MPDPYETRWGSSIELEHEVARIIAEQARNGWKFDLELAQKHKATLEYLREDLATRIYSNNIPWKYIIRDTVSAPFKKDGKLLARLLTDELGPQPEQIRGPFSRVYWEPINLDSDKQIKEYLLSIGWEPTEWNYTEDEFGHKVKSSPKLTEDSYVSLKTDVGRLISERLTYSHRLSQLNGLIAAVRPDGRIPAEANTIGTNTNRMAHRIVVNIPKAKSHVTFGKEMRELFTCDPDRILVGCDAKGLQLRMLAHYMNDSVFTSELLDGDIHTEIYDSIRDFVDSRDTGKNCTYCILFGGRDYKLGLTAGHGGSRMVVERVGQEVRQRIMRRLPALDRLIQGVTTAANRGFLWGLDGRKIWIRSPHSSLNALLMSGEAIVMKRALVICYAEIHKKGLDAFPVGNHHDEYTWDCSPVHAGVVAETASRSILEAGVYYNLNCPLAGDPKTGRDWAEIH